MVRRLPPSRVRRLSLPPEAVSRVLQTVGDDLPLPLLNENGDGAPRSLLAPLRAYRGAMRTELGGGDVTCVCTIEAVVAAVGELGMSPADCEHVLGIARRKVAAVARYRGKAGWDDS